MADKPKAELRRVVIVHAGKRLCVLVAVTNQDDLHDAIASVMAKKFPDGPQGNKVVAIDMGPGELGNAEIIQEASATALDDAISKVAKLLDLNVEMDKPKADDEPPKPAPQAELAAERAAAEAIAKAAERFGKN